MRAEISQATRENKSYIENVERAKMVEKMQETKRNKKREEAGAEVGVGKVSGKNESATAVAAPVEVRRQFRQRTAIGKNNTAEQSEAMKNLLSKVF